MTLFKLWLVSVLKWLFSDISSHTEAFGGDGDPLRNGPRSVLPHACVESLIYAGSPGWFPYQVGICVLQYSQNPFLSLKLKHTSLLPALTLQGHPCANFTSTWR